MKWFSRILKGNPGTETSVEDIIRFYQQLGFFAGAKPESVVRRYDDEWGKPPKADDPWIENADDQRCAVTGSTRTF